jgi:hypothetical protein
MFFLTCEEAPCGHHAMNCALDQHLGLVHHLLLEPDYFFSKPHLIPISIFPGVTLHALMNIRYVLRLAKKNMVSFG